MAQNLYSDFSVMMVCQGVTQISSWGLGIRDMAVLILTTSDVLSVWVGDRL